MSDIAETRLRLALYARVSTEEQREGQTIDSQIAELERFSREKGWPIEGTYKDEGWSGGVMERPDLDRLRDDAQKGQFDAVLINDVDRLARDVAHLGVIKRDLERRGVKVVFRKLPSEVSPTYNLMVNILGSFAEFERELIADRTRRGRRHKVEVRKLYLGSNTAYGYRYVPKDHASGTEGILKLNPTEASVVRRMFEWIDQEGLSARRVLMRLGERGIRPRKGAAHWGKSSVLRILRNEMYAGTWHYNKFQGCEPKNPVTNPRYRKRAKCSVRVRPKAEWLPVELPTDLQIVPRDRWERVQRQLDRNITFSPRNEKHEYLLKGLIRCGACGARYVGDPCHGAFYYRCVRRCKKLPTIRDTRLDEVVVQAVKALLLRPEMILEPLRQMRAAELQEAQCSETTHRDREAALRQLGTEEERLIEAYRTSVITPEQLGRELEKLKARRFDLETQEPEPTPAPAVPAEDIDSAVRDYCAEAASNLGTFTPAELRDFLRNVIRSIVFEGDRIRIEGQIAVPALDQTSGAAIEVKVPLNLARATSPMAPATSDLAKI